VSVSLPSGHNLARFALSQRLTGWSRLSPDACDCRCPAHEDSQASLSVSVGQSGALILHCHAGCDTRSILAALRATWQDLYPPQQQKHARPHRPGAPARIDLSQTTTDLDPVAVASPAPAAIARPASPPPPSPAAPAPKRKAVCNYDYLDAVGRHVQQVTRWEPKAFSQRHRAPTGEWIYKAPPESRRVLYHLDLIAKAPSDRPIYVCEGEKDADNLLQISRGHCLATTAPGGAAAGKSSRKWLPQFTESLRGRRVVIIPDSDSPGQQHAQHVAECVHGVAALVTILDLPLPPSIDPSRKWDLTDWIQATGAEAQRSFGLAVAAALESPWAPQQSTGGGDVGSKSPGNLTAPGGADGEGTAPGPPAVANVETSGRDSHAMPIDEICRRVSLRCDNWPRRVDKSLFVHDTTAPGRPVFWLERSPQLWAWVGGRTGEPPRFERESGTHSKEEVFYRLAQVVENYDAVETLPHVPPIENHYYADPELPPPSGDALQRLLDYFAPETEHDRAILRTAFATPFWGGPPGSRPMFVVASDAGRGAGKSTIAKVVEALSGGSLSINPLEDFQRVKNRLLSPEGMLRRLAVMDNVKSMRFSWGDLEGLITSAAISGHRLHYGEAQRANNITWYMTMNGLDLSTDMAKRSVVLKIRKPQWSGDWSEDLHTYVKANRPQLISDLCEHLRGERTPLEKSTRWGLWEKYVLGLEHNPTAILDLIVARQEGSDVEAEESNNLEDYIYDRLSELNLYPDSTRVFISALTMSSFVTAALKEKMTTIASSRLVSQRIAEGTIKHLTVAPSRKFGRGFVWHGDFAQDDHVRHDLDDVIKDRGRNTFEPF
jgi:hypothetical protein